MSAKHPLDTGTWASDIDALISAWLSGQGSDTDLPDLVRFRLAVHRLVLARESAPECEFDRTAAMVLVPPTFFETLPAGTVRRPLLNTGHYRLTGHLHFLNIVATGRSMEYAGDEAAMFESLVIAQADTLPTLVYTPKAGGHSKLSWYPTGIRNETTVSVFPVQFDEPSAERIAQSISGVYRGELITPDLVPAHDSPWKDSSKGWAAKDAEAQVQRAIKLGLHGRFPLCRIVAEQPAKDGRTDIEVVGDFARPAGEVTNYAVLELKVLREKGSTGIPYSANEIADHINNGVDQAYGYGDGRNFRERMLCCFDMRATNTGAMSVFAPVASKADTLGVGLHYWFLYRSSQEFRACKVAAALKGG